MSFIVMALRFPTISVADCVPRFGDVQEYCGTYRAGCDPATSTAIFNLILIVLFYNVSWTSSEIWQFSNQQCVVKGVHGSLSQVSCPLTLFSVLLSIFVRSNFCSQRSAKPKSYWKPGTETTVCIYGIKELQSSLQPPPASKLSLSSDQTAEVLYVLVNHSFKKVIEFLFVWKIGIWDYWNPVIQNVSSWDIFRFSCETYFSYSKRGLCQEWIQFKKIIGT